MQSKIDGRKLSHADTELIRKQAVRAIKFDNQSPEDVAKTLGMHRGTIYKWLKIYDTKGEAGLDSTKAKGPEPKLTLAQKRQLFKWLSKNPLQLKFEFALWTIEMIAQLIYDKFGVTYSSVHVGRILKEIGFSWQRPIERAYQQDPEKVNAWLKKTYPAIKREAKKEKRTIYFGDEAGFHITAQYGKTWAPVGQTPTIKTSGLREKVNCISAISNQGLIRFMLYDERFTGKLFVKFLQRLMHKQTGNVTLIVDGHKSHFTADVKAYLEKMDGKLKIYALPPYSPELNPDELVWNNAKQKVAKKKHTVKRGGFKDFVQGIMKNIQKNTELLKAFFCDPNVVYAR